MNSAQILYRFLDDNLRFADMTEISGRLNLSPKNGPGQVSKVKCALKKGRFKSKRIIDALEQKAMERFKHAQQIAEYSNKRIQL